MTDELVYQIDLAWDKIGFKNLDASISKTVKAFTVATAVVATASAAVFAMSKNYATSTDELIKTAGRVDATTQSIERLTFAAQDNGAGMDDVTGALGSLAKAQEELLRGKGDFEAWGRLGVNPTEYENTSDLLIAISDRVKDLDSTEAIDLMSRVGISPNLLQTMQQGSDGIKNLGDELEALGGITTEDMKKASQDFMTGWLVTSKTVGGILNKISASMLDNTINPAIKSFNKFVKENMKQISETLNAMFEAIAKASSFIFGLITRMAQPFIKLNNLLGGVENSVKAIGVAMLVLSRNTLIAMAPAIIAVGALFLAFDDLMSFLSGEESVIGDFFGYIGKKWQDLIQWVVDSIKMFKDLGSTISDALDFEIPELPTIGDIGSSIGNVAGGLVDDAKSFLGFGSNQQQAVAQTTSNNNIQITVDGSQNPVAVAEEVKRVLNEEMNKSASRIGY